MAQAVEIEPTDDQKEHDHSGFKVVNGSGSPDQRTVSQTIKNNLTAGKFAVIESDPEVPKSTETSVLEAVTQDVDRHNRQAKELSTQQNQLATRQELVEDKQDKITAQVDEIMRQIHDTVSQQTKLEAQVNEMMEQVYGSIRQQPADLPEAVERVDKSESARTTKESPTNAEGSPSIDRAELATSSIIPSTPEQVAATEVQARKDAERDSLEQDPQRREFTAAIELANQGYQPTVPTQQRDRFGVYLAGLASTGQMIQEKFISVWQSTAGSDAWRTPTNPQDPIHRQAEVRSQFFNRPVTVMAETLAKTQQTLTKCVKQFGPTGRIISRAETAKIQREKDSPYLELPSYKKACQAYKKYIELDERSLSSHGIGWTEKNIKKASDFQAIIGQLAKEYGSSLSDNLNESDRAALAAKFTQRFSLPRLIGAVNSKGQKEFCYLDPVVHRYITTKSDEAETKSVTRGATLSENTTRRGRFERVDQPQSIIGQRFARRRKAALIAGAVAVCVVGGGIMSGMSSAYATESAPQPIVEVVQQAQTEAEKSNDEIVSQTEARNYESDKLPAMDYHMWGQENGDGTYDCSFKNSPTSFTGEIDMSSTETIYNHLMEACESAPDQAAIFSSQLLSQEQLSQFGFNGNINQFAEVIIGGDGLRTDLLNQLSDALAHGQYKTVSLAAGSYSSYGIMRCNNGGFKLISGIQNYGANEKTVLMVSNGDQKIFIDPECDNVIEGVLADQAVAFSSEQTVERGQTESAADTTDETPAGHDDDQPSVSPDSPVTPDSGVIPKELTKINNQAVNDQPVVVNDNPGDVNNPGGVTDHAEPGGQVYDGEKTTEASSAAPETGGATEEITVPGIGPVVVDGGSTEDGAEQNRTIISGGGPSHDQAVAEAVDASGVDARGRVINAGNQMNDGRVDLN